jgi:cation transport regulator ChaC
MHTVGILAYGSLIDDPGDEIAKALTKTIRDLETPFPVEFARKSRKKRGGAPTLVPVVTGGAFVRAAIFVVNATPQQAVDMLWRRETHTEDREKGYPNARAGLLDTVYVERLENFAGLNLVLYTRIGANITPLRADQLANLAIASVATAGRGMDGISYLIDAKANGIVTALSEAYEHEVLSKTGTASLCEALASLK